MKEIVLKELTDAEIEACLSIYNINKYDITAISNDNCIVKLKVKMENLSSESTNNSILTNNNYDFLIIVVIDNGKHRFFILSKAEAEAEKKDNKNNKTEKFSISHKINGIPEIKGNILFYENRWGSIKNYKHT